MPPAVTGTESPRGAAGLWTEVDWVVTVLVIVAMMVVNTMVMMMMVKVLAAGWNSNTHLDDRKYKNILQILQA